MSTSYEKDAFDIAGDSGSGIEGQWLKCPRGVWTLDDNKIETGRDGAKICVILDSLMTGEILWKDSKIVERNTGRMADGFEMPKHQTIATGWNPYIAFQGVRADDDNLGELITYTSSSWGGLFVHGIVIVDI
jgi:hypothetical protein